MTNYDVYYFIRKFSAIPEDRWCVGKYTDRITGAHCTLGHCAESEEWALRSLFNGSPAVINDGNNPSYPQSTPKRRILAALRDVACNQLGEDEG